MEFGMTVSQREKFNSGVNYRHMEKFYRDHEDIITGMIRGKLDEEQFARIYENAKLPLGYMVSALAACRLAPVDSNIREWGVQALVESIDAVFQSNSQKDNLPAVFLMGYIKDTLKDHPDLRAMLDPIINKHLEESQAQQKQRDFLSALQP